MMWTTSSHRSQKAFLKFTGDLDKDIKSVRDVLMDEILKIQRKINRKLAN